MSGSIILTEPLFEEEEHNEDDQVAIEDNPVVTAASRRSVSNYLFIFHVIQLCLMFAGVLNLLAYSNLFYLVYPTVFAFFFYVGVYHSFLPGFRWILIPYFIYEIVFILYNMSLSFIMFMYSSHAIEFGYLSGISVHVAEIVGALELLIIPCQCIFFYMMIRNWHGEKASNFFPTGRRERKTIFTGLGILIAITIGSMIYAQLTGLI